MSDQPNGLGEIGAQRRRKLKLVDTAAPPPAAVGEEVGQGTLEFLPLDCPVRPIGVNGDLCYYLDQLGQLRELKARDHSRLNLQQMFGRKKDVLYAYWPRLTQDKTTQQWLVTGWKAELCAEALMGECAKLGVWSAEEKVRGTGAWSGKDGELIWHNGDELLLVPRTQEADRKTEIWVRRAPGLLDGMVYPTAAPGLKPSIEAQPPGPNGPAAELLTLLETWNWRRKGIDAHLLLGWIGAAMLGGALDWRVVAWITGGKATGKSTLQSAIKWMMGDHGLLQTSDATAAAIRQVLKFSSRPVALDEAEAEEDNRKMQALVKLARDAASGSISYRGGQDHQAAAFTVRSCFLFSSILIPPLLGQDRSRIAVLELDKIEASGQAKSHKLTPRTMEELGSKLQRRLIGQWYRFAETLDAYRQAMARAGHSARGQDLFGTLLACADVLLSNGLPTAEVLGGWELKLKASMLAEIDGDVSDESACLGYLLSTPLDSVTDRRRQTIGQWIAQAHGGGAIIPTAEELTYREAANRVLLDSGLKLIVQDKQHYLAVANMHRGLSKIFENTQWASRPGAPGVWKQALRRLPHQAPDKALWFGSASKATLLPVELCLDTREATPVHEPPPAVEMPPLGDYADDYNF